MRVSCGIVPDIAATAAYAYAVGSCPATPARTAANSASTGGIADTRSSAVGASESNKFCGSGIAEFSASRAALAALPLNPSADGDLIFPFWWQPTHPAGRWLSRYAQVTPPPFHSRALVSVSSLYFGC